MNGNPATPKALQTRQPVKENPRAGILLFALALAALVVLNSFAKSLVVTLPELQIAWTRYAVQVVILLCCFRYFRSTGFSLGFQWRLQLLRGLSLLGILVTVYIALTRLPLAETTMIVGITPMLVTILAWRFLDESVTLRQWLIIALGFTGALMVLRPGSVIFTPIALFAVAAAFCFASQQITTRLMHSTCNPWHTVLYTVIVGFVVLSVPVPWIWVAPSVSEWGLILCNGVLAVVSDSLLVLAFERASASTLAPAQYLQILYALAIGAVVFGEFPDLLASFGAVLIVVAGIILLKGQRAARANTAPKS